MNLQLVFLIIFFGTSMFPAYALWEQPKGVELFLQIQIRDSSGVLIAYIEGKPRIFDLDRFEQWLESQSVKYTFVKNGKIYEVLRTSYESSFSETNTKGGYFVKLPINGGQIDYVMHMDHGSYHVKPGDTITAYLTLIRQT
jgi:hypothetical protein